MKVSSAWLLLANDYGEAVTFTQRLPGGRGGSLLANSSSGGGDAAGSLDSSGNLQQPNEAGGRSWLRTPLQVRRSGLTARAAHWCIPEWLQSILNGVVSVSCIWWSMRWLRHQFCCTV